jgi:hypothetical protein
VSYEQTNSSIQQQAIELICGWRFVRTDGAGHPPVSKLGFNRNLNRLEGTHMQKNHLLAFGMFVFGLGACDGTVDVPQSASTASRDVASADQCATARTWRAEHAEADLTYEDLLKFPVECQHAVFGMPPDRCDTAHTWVYENRGEVMSYDELLGFPVECRKFIYGEQPKSVQSSMWITQFDRYKAAHLSMTDEQRAALERAVSLLSSERVGADHDSPEWAAVETEIHELELQAIRAFGRYEAGMLIAQLGPADSEGIPEVFEEPKL